MNTFPWFTAYGTTFNRRMFQILAFLDHSNITVCWYHHCKCLLLLTSSAVWCIASFLWCTYTRNSIEIFSEYLCLCWSVRLSLHNKSSVKEINTNISMVCKPVKVHIPSQQSHHVMMYLYHRKI
jgi:hypothetical protein